MAATLLVDSSAWIAYFNGEENPLIEMGLAAQAIQVCPLSVTEILGNILAAKERSQLEAFFSKIPSPQISAAHYQKAGKLKADLAAKNFFISARDAHVLQCALDIKGMLVTRDSFLLELQPHTGIKVVL